MRRSRSPFVAVLAELRDVLAALKLDWYLFGAQAALIYGAARVTADIDVTVRLGKVTPAQLATALKRRGFRLRVDDPSFVRTTRVLPILHVSTSIPADLVLAGPGLEDAFLEHAVIHELGGVSIPVASAEDLIVMKVLAGREKDLYDVTAIVAARHSELDTDAIAKTLEMVEQALGQSDLLVAWKRLHAGVMKPGQRKRVPPVKADSSHTPPPRTSAVSPGRKRRLAKKK